MPTDRSIASVIGQCLLVLLVAAAAYVGMGWFALDAMFRIYGGSGHPPAPSAPNEVYIGVFLVGLPILALLVGVTVLWLGKMLLRRPS